ncbi:zinc-finger domain-containing protein [Magnetospira sp. QH-2]|uniref:zinc-finger domain-containing protein n=1 Tax=Magnetospira sp. (strain QH-2) TaxID=1288970 RepID=UPI0003E81A70|nr:zinc-finger domain-containing protein [Magnetospira sp. QH-2]CCQ75348.1 conserved protein of unknown function[Include Zinc-finger domain] [Magnetospira sp. QH-2]
MNTTYDTREHVIEVDSPTFSCDGGGDDALGHPAVFLHTDANGHAVCPYCSQIFQLKAGAKSGGH